MYDPTARAAAAYRNEFLRLGFAIIIGSGKGEFAEFKPEPNMLTAGFDDGRSNHRTPYLRLPLKIIARAASPTAVLPRLELTIFWLISFRSTRFSVRSFCISSTSLRNC